MVYKILLTASLVLNVTICHAQMFSPQMMAGLQQIADPTTLVPDQRGCAPGSTESDQVNATFPSCPDSAGSAQPDVRTSSLTAQQRSFCGLDAGSSAQSLFGATFGGVMGNDLKKAFNCTLAFELQKNLEKLRETRDCFGDAKVADVACNQKRRELFAETSTAYNQSLSALVRAEGYDDRRGTKSTAFTLEMDIGAVEGLPSPGTFERTPRERIECIIDDRVAPSAGLASLSFQGVNIDSVLENFGGDAKLLGAFQGVPRLPQKFIERERDKFVSYVSDVLVVCERGGSYPRANSVAQATVGLMGKAQICNEPISQGIGREPLPSELGPYLEFRQEQAQARYSELVARNPQIAYLNVQPSDLSDTAEAPLRLSENKRSRDMMKAAYDQVVRNTEKFQKMLLENRIDYDTETVLLPAMDSFLAHPKNKQYCGQARNIAQNLRPIAAGADAVKSFAVSFAAYTACYSTGVATTGLGGLMACPAVIEGARTVLTGQKSLRLSQVLTSATNDDVVRGIASSGVLSKADQRFVEAFEDLMNVPREAIFGEIASAGVYSLATEAVRRGLIPIGRNADGTPNEEKAIADAYNLIEGLIDATR